jgi:hypothetical protein
METDSEYSPLSGCPSHQKRADTDLKVYRKPTDTGHYLNFESNIHPMEQFRAYAAKLPQFAKNDMVCSRKCNLQLNDYP